jgi:archaeosine synthase
MTTLERGYISLTIDGAKRIASQDHYWVEIASDFTLKGSVFTPGIIDADPAIRSGDEVIIRQENSLKAVGVATMHAREMIDARAGEAVKTRHIIS